MFGYLTRDMNNNVIVSNKIIKERIYNYLVSKLNNKVMSNYNFNKNKEYTEERDEYYGYDVKENPEELVFASEVLMMAMSPGREQGGQALAGVIGKMLVMAKGDVLKDALKKKTLKQMAEAGGAQLIYVPIRALAHKAAKNALNKAGKKGLEKSIFSDVLQQIGKRLPQNVARKSIPIIGGRLGACFDTATMNNILRFAEICYHKRFLVEKEMRINEITGNGKFIYDVEYEE